MTTKKPANQSAKKRRPAKLSMYGANVDDVIKAAFQVPNPIPKKKKVAKKKAKKK